ncbi:MAG: hypothetical protein ACLTM5_06500 [Dialister sp.]
MKKIITAFCLFMSLLTGSAFADTLKLPGGEVLDFGDKVDVWTMEESFFSRPGNSLAGKEKNIVKSGTDLIPGSSSLVAVPQNITDKMKVYQLRSYTPEAFHQAVAVSASLSGKDREVMEKLLARNHEKAVIKWHCTNEFFTLNEYIKANCEYPRKLERRNREN